MFWGFRFVEGTTSNGNFKVTVMAGNQLSLKLRPHDDT